MRRPPKVVGRPKADRLFEHPQKRAFLAAYAETASISAAAEASKVARGSHYVWMRDDSDYAAEFERIKPEAIQVLEDEAVRRAVKGSDLLLIFLLKGALPEKYRDQWKGELTGKNGGPLAISVLDTILNDSDDGKETEDPRDPGRPGKVRSEVAPG